MRSHVVIAAVAWLLACVPAAWGELVYSEEESGSHTVFVYRLTVTPAAEPSPAMRYRLVRQAHETDPGNAVLEYLRMPHEGGMPAYQKIVERFGEVHCDWYGGETPLDEIPLDKAKELLGWWGNALGYLESGSRRRECDWGRNIEDKSGAEFVSLLLPDIQGMRNIARFAALDVRVALAEGRSDDALERLRQMYQLARDVADEPILICDLVGIAIDGITNSLTLEWMAQPNAPNLYWALGELEAIDVDDAIRFEMGNGLRWLGVVANAETASHSAAEWNVLWMRDAKFFAEDEIWNLSAPHPVEPAPRDLLPMLVGIAGYTHAKERLVAWGFDRDRVEAMAVGQVLAIYSSRAYRLVADDIEKGLYVPYAESHELARRADERIRQSAPFSGNPDRELLPVASLWLPAVSAARTAEVRSKCNLAVLRTIEAVRMHAAVAGALPKSLAEVTCVPVPRNAGTGKAFDYELVERDGVPTAVLRMPVGQPDPGLEKRYEIQLAK